MRRRHGVIAITPYYFFIALFVLCEGGRGGRTGLPKKVLVEWNNEYRSPCGANLKRYKETPVDDDTIRPFQLENDFSSTFLLIMKSAQ